MKCCEWVSEMGGGRGLLQPFYSSANKKVFGHFTIFWEKLKPAHLTGSWFGKQAAYCNDDGFFDGWEDFLEFFRGESIYSEKYHLWLIHLFHLTSEKNISRVEKFKKTEKICRRISRITVPHCWQWSTGKKDEKKNEKNNSNTGDTFENLHVVDFVAGPMRSFFKKKMFFWNFSATFFQKFYFLHFFLKKFIRTLEIAETTVRNDVATVDFVAGPTMKLFPKKIFFLHFFLHFFLFFLHIFKSQLKKHQLSNLASFNDSVSIPIVPFPNSFAVSRRLHSGTWPYLSDNSFFRSLRFTAVKWNYWWARLIRMIRKRKKTQENEQGKLGGWKWIKM